VDDTRDRSFPCDPNESETEPDTTPRAHPKTPLSGQVARWQRDNSIDDAATQPLATLPLHGFWTHANLMPQVPIVIGVDIGGTKIKAGAVRVGPGDVGTTVVASQEIATPRAEPAAFYDAVARLVEQVRASAEGDGFAVLPLVAVAHPGRFLHDGLLARGTTPNLGTAPGQFDGCVPAQELQYRLSMPVFAENDAIAQMRFGMDALLRDAAVRSHLLGQTVVYLGPGTGMGGGVARIDHTGEVTVITDGHLFDLRLPGVGDSTLTAEEVFTGPAIAHEVTRRNRGLSRPIEPPTAPRIDEILRGPEPRASAEQRTEAAQLADAYGDLLALVIATVHSGRIVKVRLETTPDGAILRHVDEPDRAWSAADRAAAREARVFLLGGSVGCSRGLGRRLQHRALETLRQRGLGHLVIFQVPVASADAGWLGAVKSLPIDELRRLATSGGPSALRGTD